MTVLKISTLIATLVLSTSAFAVNPTGGNGDGKGEWKEEWSEAFFDCWDEAAERSKGGKGALEDATRNLTDVGPGKEWCPTEGALSEDYQIKLFYLATFKALAKPESGYRPEAQGFNKGRYPTGLFQMDFKDARSHGCRKDGGGTISSNEDLKDAETNICCALTIANGQASKSKGKATLARGKDGVMGEFWQPMREGMGGDGRGNQTVNNTKNSKEIKKTVAEACESLPSGGYSGSGDDAPLTTKEFELAQQSDGGGSGSSGGTITKHFKLQGGSYVSEKICPVRRYFYVGHGFGLTGSRAFHLLGHAAGVER